MSYIEINDIFDELRDVNKRLFNELLSANNLINILSEFKSFIDSIFNTFNTDSKNLNKYQELCLKIQEHVKRKPHKIITGSDDKIGDSGKTLIDTKTVHPKRVYTKRARPKSHFLCPFDGCDNKYNTRNQLQEHTQTEHLPVVPEYETDSECDETNQRSKLKKHVCQYSGCKYKTNKIRCLRKHVEKHIRPRVFHYLCKHCKIGFKSDDKWRSHMKSVHNNDRPYVCDHIGCQLAYRSSQYLRLHKISHNEKDLHRCTEPGCDRKFKSKEYLKKHVLYVHSQPDRLKCEWPGCEFNTGDPRHMNRHKRVHIQERPFVCDVDQCGKAFMDKLQLTRHKNVVHRLGTVFECYWPGCEYSTGDKISMRTHESIHKTGGGEYVCSWPECGKRMAHKQSLEDHINAIHKNVKPFSCPVAGCPYRTAFRRNIRQHSKTHRDKASKKSIPNDSKS